MPISEHTKSHMGSWFEGKTDNRTLNEAGKTQLWVSGFILKNLGFFNMNNDT